MHSCGTYDMNNNRKVYGVSSAICEWTHTLKADQMKDMSLWYLSCTKIILADAL